MLVQDAGEIPIGLCVYDQTLTWWLSALLILSLLTVGVQVGFMLLGTLGNGGPGDGGGSGRGLIPYPPDPTPLGSRIQFKQVVHAHGAGLETGTVRPIVGREFPLAEAPRAHVAVMEPGAHGKIVILA